jgi:hypothetical protein
MRLDRRSRPVDEHALCAEVRAPSWGRLEVKDMGHGGWTPQPSLTVLSKAIGFLEGVLK